MLLNKLQNKKKQLIERKQKRSNELFYLDHNVNHYKEEKLDMENVYLHQNNQFFHQIPY